MHIIIIIIIIIIIEWKMVDVRVKGQEAHIYVYVGPKAQSE